MKSSTNPLTLTVALTVAFIVLASTIPSIHAFSTLLTKGANFHVSPTDANSNINNNHKKTFLTTNAIQNDNNNKELTQSNLPSLSDAFLSLSTCSSSVVSCLALSLLLTLGLSNPAWADGQTEKFRYPPIDYNDKERCVLKSGSSMGQANAARDKLYDLRQCKLSGVDASGYDLSGVIMSGTDVSKSIFREAYFSKGFLQDSNFENADFSNAIVDRASFRGSSLKGAIFNNAVLTGTSFAGANVENVDFTDAAIGIYDLRNLCSNPTLKGENPTTGAETRTSAGCN